jgi:hypothetical protein
MTAVNSKVFTLIRKAEQKQKFVEQNNVTAILFTLSTDRQFSNPDSAMGWTIEKSRFDSRQTQEILNFLRRSRLALGPTQPSIQWVPGTLASGVKVNGT